MTRDPLRSLALDWRATAENLARFGAEGAAAAFRQCAEALEGALGAADTASLTLAEAAELSGYSKSALQKAVAAGRLENVGRKHAPRVRRADLPKKGAHANAPRSLAALVSRPSR